MDKDDRERPRPSPEALLEAARRDAPRSGRLKIFLGAAPGVGKTYAMLLAAKARLKENVDVVAAVVETHGRAETGALVAGLETISRRQLFYRGHALDEMDIDAVLARRPALALVDELAHTNAEGSRHPKRYQDVEELLDAGIDVYTTLNVQHVESLNTVVAQITRVRVRETVPDRILDRADDIEVVDLSPEDLIQRLTEGKVYVPRQAERALRHFFSPGNLTALRELALRRTAQRVDAQLLAHMQSKAISGPWAAGERVLVCIGTGVDGEGLVRHAKRVADRMHAPATVLHIETGRQGGGEAALDRVSDTMRLAARLGLETLTMPGGGRRMVDDILTYAHSNNVTQIIVGRTTRIALVRGPAWLGRQRAGTPRGGYQCPCHRNGGRAGIRGTALRKCAAERGQAALAICMGIRLHRGRPRGRRSDRAICRRPERRSCVPDGDRLCGRIVGPLCIAARGDPRDACL